MGISVRGAALARPFEICGDGAGSSPQFWKQKFNSPAAVGPVNLPDRDCARSLTHVDASAAAQRRAAALDASLDQVLILASARASEQLKTTRPKLSAATLPAYQRHSHSARRAGVCIDFRHVQHDRAFRHSRAPNSVPDRVIVHSKALSADCFADPPFPDEELPVYTVILPLRAEAGVVDQLLSGMERLDYPPEKLDVIIAVEADDC